MQYDTLDERIANAVEFDIVPQYDQLSTSTPPRAAPAAEVAANEAPPTLSLRGLGRSFGGRPAVDDITLDIGSASSSPSSAHPAAARAR